MHVAYQVLTPRGSPRGFALLRFIRKWVELNMLISLEVHTEKTLTAYEQTLHRFHEYLEVRIVLYSTISLPLYRLDSGSSTSRLASILMQRRSRTGTVSSRFIPKHMRQVTSGSRVSSATWIRSRTRSSTAPCVMRIICKQISSR